jgi:hypothetical protein
MENNKYKYKYQFIIEKGYKTSYISSLLMGLFYKSNTNLEVLINTFPDNPAIIYLQELIKDNFVYQVRKHFSIKNQNINEIRNYMLINKYINKQDIINDENLENNNLFYIIQEDIGNFYKYLLDCFNGEYIYFEIFKITDNTILTVNNKLKLPYISINPTSNTSIRELFINWLDKYINKNNTYSYKLLKIPTYLAFYINRYDNNDNRIKYEIDIMKKIKFFNNIDSTQKYIQWKIHAIICNEGEKFEDSHYYSVLNDYNNNWILFNDNNIPSVSQIDMGNDDIIEKIRKECMFIIYVIND